MCGPTVDGVPHLGHGRFSLVFDVLRRYLLFSGLDVTYVSNITDIEDKIIDRAAAQGVPIAEFTAANEALWWEIMDALGVLRPDETPHATAYVDRMVDLIDDLVGPGGGLRDGHRRLPVGARRPRLRAARPPAARVAAGRRPDRGRRGEAVAARLRAVEEGQAGRAELGGAVGRRAGPGWHTECVVMSLDLLGEGFELHGGGQDLMFPHHENERAQAVADGKEFARHWMHNGWVTVGGEKMSKSLGNFTSLADLLARSDARAYRLLVLRSHYRSPIEVTPDTIAQAEAGLARLDELARRFALPDLLAEGPPTGAGVRHRRRRRRTRVAAFTAAMDDDLDTPGALATVFDLARRANAAADAGDAGGAPTGRPARRRCSPPRSACACRPAPTTRWTRPPPALVRARDEARAGPGLGPGRRAARRARGGRLAGRGRRRGDPDPPTVGRARTGRPCRRPTGRRASRGRTGPVRPVVNAV